MAKDANCRPPSDDVHEDQVIAAKCCWTVRRARVCVCVCRCVLYGISDFRKEKLTCILHSEAAVRVNY